MVLLDHFSNGAQNYARFENYATFYLSVFYEKKEKQTKSKLYIWRQLSMKSSLF